MFKATPGVHRTPRTRAEEMNDAKSFVDGPEYHAQGGHPITKDMPKQPYKDLAPQVRAIPANKQIPSPFKGGK